VLKPPGRSAATDLRPAFLREFVCPVIVLAVFGALGGLGSALLVLGIVAMAAAVAMRLLRPAGATEPVLAST
jgi:uncharacterized membrane protein